jgi:hypothetical protein
MPYDRACPLLIIVTMRTERTGCNKSHKKYIKEWIRKIKRRRP